jgi:putative nucleotidyltransferase with HDIG domain
MVKITAELENKIEEFAVSLLRQGRKDWDEPHTRAVVYYAHKLGEGKDINQKVLITAAWLHDIGYIGLFDEDSQYRTFEEIKQRKALHMEKGAEMAKEFLNQAGIREFYNPDEIDRVIHLVKVHDKLSELKDLDEIILAEADTLGALDYKRVKHTLDQKSMESWIEGVKRKRAPIFATDMGKKYLRELLPHYG